MAEHGGRRVVLITGTAGGQGRAAALAFAGLGAVVVGCDLKVEDNLETAALVRRAGGTMSVTAPIDLGDPDAARSWVEDAAAQFGQIDVVYNNAASARFAPIPDMTIEDWRYTIRNELDLVFHVTKFAWPHLVATGGGVVINVASIAGLVGSHNAPIAAHAATKGAVIAMTRQLAVEGAPHGIRAVCITPGVVEAPGSAELFPDPAVREALVGANLVRRPGRPTDVAELAVWLASADASWITGANFVVDGGRTVT